MVPSNDILDVRLIRRPRNAPKQHKPGHAPGFFFSELVASARRSPVMRRAGLLARLGVVKVWPRLPSSSLPLFPMAPCGLHPSVGLRGILRAMRLVLSRRSLSNILGRPGDVPKGNHAVTMLPPAYLPRLAVVMRVSRKRTIRLALLAVGETMHMDRRARHLIRR